MREITKDKDFKLKDFFKPHTFSIIMYILISIITSAISVFNVIILAQGVEYLALGEMQKSINAFLFTICLVAINQILDYVDGMIYYNVSTKIMTNINYAVSKQAFKLNAQTYINHDSGTFLTRIKNDPKSLVAFSANIIDDTLTLLSQIGALIYIFISNYQIGLLLIIILAVAMLIDAIRINKFKKNRVEARKLDDSINSLINQVVIGQKDIKSLNLENRLALHTKESYSKFRKVERKMGKINTSFYAFRNIITRVATLLILVLGIIYVNKGLITFSVFIMLYSNRNSLINLTRGVGMIRNSIVESKICINRMYALFDNKEFVCEKFGDVVLNNPKGEIEFKNVAYTYVTYKKNENNNKGKNKHKIEDDLIVDTQHKIFDNLSFKIEANTTVAFVGNSGSGKSTILDLASKMIEVDSGEVLIDGININDLSKDSLRKNISLVNQFPYIFDMSIRDNLLLAKENASEEELEQALIDASFYDFVKGLKNGIDTVVGEGGVKLSGGQRQRLSIARAMLRKSKVLIFDESTSSLDNFAQNNIKKSIDNLKGKSTIIIVAHRLSTIKDVDKIYYLDNGEIVASGTFNELFKTNEKFKAMYYAESLINYEEK